VSPKLNGFKEIGKRQWGQWQAGQAISGKLEAFQDGGRLGVDLAGVGGRRQISLAYCK